MATEATNADHARRRADEAGVRARQLRDIVVAARDGKEPLHGSSPEELDAAVERAEHAAHRLRHALVASADAHDRAAEAYEEHIRRHGDPDGHRALRALFHRGEAAKDRDRAAEVDGPM
jgi:hypothetical protein